MKKFIICLLACVACLQTSYSFGAVTAFAESIREMDAILDATADPEFSSLFAADDFAVDLERLTPKLNTAGKVYYLFEVSKLGHHNDRKKSTFYIVKLKIEENPAIGPLLITVKKFTPVREADISKFRK